MHKQAATQALPPEQDGSLPGLPALEAAAGLVYRHLQASPQLCWPLLSERCECEVWVKHENHNPTGNFKVRGGLVYMQRLRERLPDCGGVVTATRGNHGQSVAFAAGVTGLKAVIVVPEGNNPDKNRAMQALGAELVVHGKDFDESRPHVAQVAEERGFHPLPAFHSDLVEGVASYSLELLRAQPDLERVFVPIGLGSGICGMVCARNALGLDTEIVGVVSEQADCYARSLAAPLRGNRHGGHPGGRAGGAGCAGHHAGQCGPHRDRERRDHGCGAALLQRHPQCRRGRGGRAPGALLKDPDRKGRKLGVALSGGNIDSGLYREILA